MNIQCSTPSERTYKRVFDEKDVWERNNGDTQRGRKGFPWHMEGPIVAKDLVWVITVLTRGTKRTCARWYKERRDHLKAAEWGNECNPWDIYEHCPMSNWLRTRTRNVKLHEYALREEASAIDVDHIFIDDIVYRLEHAEGQISGISRLTAGHQPNKFGK